MKKIRKLLPVITALLIALSLSVTTGCGGVLGVISCIGCLGALENADWDLGIPSVTEPAKPSVRPESSSGTEETTEPGTKPEKPSSPVTIGDGSFVYEEYDPEEFLSGCDRLEELAEGKDADAVIDLYEDLYREYVYIDEDGSILYVAYSENPADEYLSDQYIEYDKMSQDCTDRFLTAIRAVCDGPCKDAFREHVGDEYFEAFAEYEPLTDEQTEMFNRETELVDEYYTAIEDAEESGMDDSELVNIVGPIYVELVQLRTEIAKSFGYDNYADYADENIYCRDFTGDDIRKFCDSVKKFSSEYYDLLYNSSAYYLPYYIEEHPSTRELLSDLQTYAEKISPLASDAAHLLTSEQLYSIGDSDERMSGAYTISFAQSDIPFIFQTADGNATDFTTLSHEFGHFTAFSLNMNPNILLYGYGSLELSEIHSNGLQALFTHYYDEIYGNQYSGIMAVYNVINLLSNVVDGCFFDEFQREIYAHPDMTLDDINQLYKDLCAEYGDTYSIDQYGADYWWIHVSHSFESPMYYFSYAASGIVALQIWLTSQTDMDKAVSIWEHIVEGGPYAYGYMELLDQVDVSDFTNAPAVLMTGEMALNFIRNNAN